MLPVLKLVNETRHRLSALPHPRVEVVGLWGSAKTVLAVQTALAAQRSLVFVTPGRIEAEAVRDDLCTFFGEERSFLFPAWEVLHSDVMTPSDDIVAERMHALEHLVRMLDAGEPAAIVMPVRALMQPVIPKQVLTQRLIHLQTGSIHDIDSLTATLVDIGYEREVLVEQRGHFSIRGGILDIFPISAELPCRIEFFGDEIETIRTFEPETQRSITHVDAVTLLPRSEKRLLEANDSPCSIAAYLPSDAVFIIDEPLAAAEEAARLEEQFGSGSHLFSWSDVQEKLAPFPLLMLASTPFAKSSDAAVRLSAQTTSITPWRGNTEGFWNQLVQWDLDGYTVHLLCNNSGERRRLIELLEERGYRLDRDKFDLHVEIGRLRAGFVSPDDRLAVLSEREMFGRHYTRRTRRRFEMGESLKTFSDLKPGDYIVHEFHGIGCYLGLKRFADKGGDFIGIQYQSGDRLYVPVASIDAIQKYAAGEGSSPKLDRLGGATWIKTKSRVKKKLKDMTEELVRLYAARATHEGTAFSRDTPWQVEFEDAFEYDETPDQERAIVEVKRDMESPRPMDRLICGDVGFGKTEVALRAVFKAVTDGKQAAVLVPTTVLAEQHYNTFSERLADYPIRVEMLSRFRTQKELNATIERIKSGEVDLIVGTHRLLSKDIQFKELGLLVIDEEQRFGVAQKETIKKLKTQVDVLTLTATPIPRTLNMALLSVRDMSIINTAPNDRLPVHTCVENFDERLIQEAVRRELARGGQVFFVHNRIHNILYFAELVQRLAPHARVVVGHGQMHERELEQVMMKFIRGDADVLVCTTIIGSGIDIPNANTIIINDADRFGMAELYQLRGRVGRYKHRAFAYLLVSGDKALSEEAQKRLKTLEEFSALGSGLRIAMRDLEIRGCGNLLGGEQHGCIMAVGYDTYAHLLQEAVAEIRGEAVRSKPLPPCEIAVDASIPDSYVAIEAQKITLYKRIASLKSVDEVDEMFDELKDRFGAPPPQVSSLLDIMRIRAQALEAGVRRIVGTKSAIAVEFDSDGILTPRICAVLKQQFGKRILIAIQDKPTLTLNINSPEDHEIIESARRLLHTLINLSEAAD